MDVIRVCRCVDRIRVVWRGHAPEFADRIQELGLKRNKAIHLVISTVNPHRADQSVERGSHIRRPLRGSAFVSRGRKNKSRIA